MTQECVHNSETRVQAPQVTNPRYVRSQHSTGSPRSKTTKRNRIRENPKEPKNREREQNPGSNFFQLAIRVVPRVSQKHPALICFSGSEVVIFALKHIHAHWHSVPRSSHTFLKRYTPIVFLWFHFVFLKQRSARAARGKV